jgi:hypothetical protein
MNFTLLFHSLMTLQEKLISLNLPQMLLKKLLPVMLSMPLCRLRQLLRKHKRKKFKLPSMPVRTHQPLMALPQHLLMLALNQPMDLPQLMQVLNQLPLHEL